MLVRIDPAIEKVLQTCSLEVKFLRKHDHVFAVFPDGKRVIVGSKRKLNVQLLRNTVANVRRVIKECSSSVCNR